jgi:hypothetical protein
MEEKLAQSLFERGAEKCFDKNTRVAFCKKYLIDQGIDINPPKPVTPNYSLQDLQNFGREETYTFTARETVDHHDLNMVTHKTALMHNVKADLVNKLMHELVKNDMIYFEEMKNYAMDSVEVYAGIKAAKWDKR